MPVQALLRFVQGPNSDSAGRAVAGTLTDGACTVSNGNNAGVISWKYEMLYVPPGSLVPLTVQGPGAFPTFSFTPDVAGSYRIRLTVANSTASDINTDIRCFCVPFPGGIIAPPYQRNPAPLPLTGAGGKPDEMNIAGQPHGWDGINSASAKLMYQALKEIDASIAAGASLLPRNGSLAMTGDLNLGAHLITNTRGLVIDYTSNTNLWPVLFQSSAIYPNGITQGYNCIRIHNVGLNNNQPTFRITYNVETTSYGNTGVIIENLGGTHAPTQVFSGSCEILANNTTVNAYNGKGEWGQASGQTAGIARYQDGYFYIAYRRGPEHPSGANSGFHRHVNILPNTLVGKGEMHLRGYGIYIEPEWDFATWSYITNENSYNSTLIENMSLSSNLLHWARIENSGYGDSYIRNRSRGGGSSIVHSQADAGVAAVEVRSNWITPGTNDAELRLYVASDGSGYLFEAKGSGRDLNIVNRNGATSATTINIDGASQGLVTFYRWDTMAKGRIRLGDGSGAAGGGIVEYDSAKGSYNFTGTDDYFTFSDEGYVEPARSDNDTSPIDGGSYAPAKAITTLLVLNSADFAAYTINLPTVPLPKHTLMVWFSKGVTTLTMVPGAGATVVGSPRTIATGGAWIRAFYRDTGSSTGIWYIG